MNKSKIVSFIEIVDFKIKFICWCNIKRRIEFWMRRCIRTPIPSNNRYLQQALKDLENFELRYKVELS